MNLQKERKINKQFSSNYLAIISSSFRNFDHDLTKTLWENRNNSSENFGESRATERLPGKSNLRQELKLQMLWLLSTQDTSQGEPSTCKR